MKDWESYARQFHTAREHGPEFVRATMEQLAETAGVIPDELPRGPWVDIGAGTGRLSGGLADYWNRDVIALEPQPVMIGNRESHPRVRWVRGSALEPPLRAASVAGVFLHLVLHQISEWRQALRQLAMTLVDGGLFAVRTGNPDRFPEDEDSAVFPRLEQLVKARFVPVEELVEAFEQHGLQTSVAEFTLMRTVKREEYLASIENKMTSTLRMLTDEEFQIGLARLREKYASSTSHIEQRRHALFIVGRR